MNELHDRLHSAVAEPTPPDADDLWSRGRRAARRRTALLAIGGLLALVGVAAALTQLTDNDSALDTIDQPGEPDSEIPTIDASLPVIDVPIGAPLRLYPLDLPDGWSVEVISLPPDGDLVELTMQSTINDDYAFISFNDLPTPGDKWFEDAVPSDGRPGSTATWENEGWRGSIRLLSAETTARDLFDETASTGLLEMVDAPAPGEWEVVVDNRWSLGSSLLSATSPSGEEASLVTQVFNRLLAELRIPQPPPVDGEELTQATVGRVSVTVSAFREYGAFASWQQGDAVFSASTNPQSTDRFRVRVFRRAGLLRVAARVGDRPPGRVEAGFLVWVGCRRRACRGCVRSRGRGYGDGAGRARMALSV